MKITKNLSCLSALFFRSFIVSIMYEIPPLTISTSDTSKLLYFFILYRIEDMYLLLQSLKKLLFGRVKKRRTYFYKYTLITSISNAG